MIPKFIKLSGCIINPLKIIHINIAPKQYTIILDKHNLSGSWILSSGYMEYGHSEIIIDKSSDSQDYKIIQEWIDNNT